MNEHNYILGDKKIIRNERKTLAVVILTTITMFVEIIYGYLTSSMALLADGWHMMGHAGALGISVISYKLAKRHGLNKLFSFGGGKLIPLGGYTSALSLGAVSVFMVYESIHRMYSPKVISFDSALIVAVIGLVVNLISANILSDEDHHHHGSDSTHDHHQHKDHNLKSAYMHVLADALTSILAIAALFIGKNYQLLWADPLMGIIGGIVILKWAWGLCLETGKELLDWQITTPGQDDFSQYFNDDEFIVVKDFHLWRVAPNALACEMVVETKEIKGNEYYQSRLKEHFPIKHMVVEEILPKLANI